MGRISQWAVRQPIFALITWFVLMAGIVVASILFGGEYNDDFELPDTESTTAQDLLGQLSGSAGTGAGLEGQIVWSADSGEVTDEGTQQVITDLLTEISESPGVQCVVSPFGEPLGADCPEQPADQGGGDGAGASGQEGQNGQEPPAEEPSPEAQGAMAHFGQAGISPDGTVAYATAVFEGATFDDLDDRRSSMRSSRSRHRTAKTACRSEPTVCSRSSGASRRRRRASAWRSPWSSCCSRSVHWRARSCRSCPRWFRYRSPPVSSCHWSQRSSTSPSSRRSWRR